MHLQHKCAVCVHCKSLCPLKRPWSPGLYYGKLRNSHISKVGVHWPAQHILLQFVHNFIKFEGITSCTMSVHSLKIAYTQKIPITGEWQTSLFILLQANDRIRLLFVHNGRIAPDVCLYELLYWYMLFPKYAHWSLFLSVYFLLCLIRRMSGEEIL